MQQLYDAVKKGDLECVKYLVSNGADIKADNNRAVSWASKYGHLEVVKYLVSNGADNNYAVRFASCDGHLDVVKYLVSIGADIKADNNCAVRWASENGHLDIIKYLVSIGADYRWISNNQSNLLINDFYNNGNFELAYKIALFINYPNNDLFKSLKKICENRNNFHNRMNYKIDTILFIKN